jgi:hypothetical protein
MIMNFFMKIAKYDDHTKVLTTTMKKAITNPYSIKGQVNGITLNKIVNQKNTL